MNISSLNLENPFFLAPMEAVNCASFRLLCRKRGASLVYTDMIDVDVFMEFARENSKKKAIQKFINPLPDEKPLAVQIGGANIDNLLETAKIIQSIADLIDYNASCPLNNILAKKSGVFLMKHPDQLYKKVEALRAEIKKPFTVKIRSGWDSQSINAIEVSQQLEKLGIDAVALHPRTRKQGYRDRADWPLARKVKEAISIPLILSGDVTNAYLAHMALAHTKCDFIMLARGAKANPSVFRQLVSYWKDKKQPAKLEELYIKTASDARRDFMDFLKIYKRHETRYKFSEIQDHALWTASQCLGSSRIKQKLLSAKKEDDLINLFRYIRF